MTKDNLYELFEVLKNKHIFIGEAAIIIQRNFQDEFKLPGKYVSYSTTETCDTIWEELPDNELDRLKEFFINNHFRFFAMLEPQRHDEIMKMQSQEGKQYQEHFNSHGEHGKKMMCDRKVVAQTEQWYKKGGME